MRLAFHKGILQLKKPFAISKGTYAQRAHLIVELVQDDVSGFGEMTVIDYYGVDLETSIKRLLSLRSKIESVNLCHPSDLYHHIFDDLKQDTFLLSALDCAAYDLYGKIHKQPIHALLELPPKQEFTCSYTLGLDEVTTELEQIEWPCIKIKMGGPNDDKILQLLKNHPKRPFRVDANEAWSVQQLRQIIENYADDTLEFIEQPMHRSQDQQLVGIDSKIPIIADEAFQGISDIEGIRGRYHGINIKLMKCGGITAAIDIIKQAKQQELKLMLGCMTESSIGISAAAALAPMVDYVDLDGALLIHDPAEGISYRNGKVIKTNGWGLGCNFKT